MVLCGRIKPQVSLEKKPQCGHIVPARWIRKVNWSARLVRSSAFDARRFISMPNESDKGVSFARHKDSRTDLHDGRLLTLEDAVEFFNLILGVQLTPGEKKNLVAFMRTLDSGRRRGRCDVLAYASTIGARQ